nr:hypothetical protein [Fundidesulfovibrio soli]
MEGTRSSTLAARIVNCLQTILELEPLLQRIDSGSMLLPEFKVLKSFLNEMDGIDLDEEDVARIENATERFLQELKTPSAMARAGETKNQTLQ